MVFTIAGSLGLALAVPTLGGLSILIGLTAFLAVAFRADRIAARKSIHCPKCRRPLFNRLTRILVTGRCPACHRPIVKSIRYRSHEVIQRRARMYSRKLTAILAWVLIACSALVLLERLFGPVFRTQSPNAIVLLPSISLFVVWAYLRTWERRFFLPAVLSVFLFIGSLAGLA